MIRLHACRLDRDCRRWGKPNRVSLLVGTRYYALSLNRESKFVVGMGPATRWTDVRTIAKGDA